jgi:hypothetical protein
MAVPAEVAQEVARTMADGTRQFFDESLIVHEDVDLAKRIESSGRSLVFRREAWVSHYRDTNWRDFLRRNFDLGRACRRLRVQRLPQTLLALFVLGMGASLAAGLLFGPLGGAVFVIPGAYSLLLLFGALHGSLVTRSLGALFRIPGFTAGLHLSRSLGYLMRSDRRKSL